MTPPLDMAWSVNHCSARQGTPRGISVDAIDAIAARAGIAPTWRFFRNRAEMIAALARGEIDMATGATGADLGTPLKLSHPYLAIRQVVVRVLAATRLPTHRLAYVAAQGDQWRSRPRIPLTPVVYPVSSALCSRFRSAMPTSSPAT